MTESFDRGGERPKDNGGTEDTYGTPTHGTPTHGTGTHGTEDIHPSSPVDPAWPAPPAQPPGRGRRRLGAPLGLLTAVALVAALVGGGTAYGIQKLTDVNGGTTVAAADAAVVPTAKRGTVAGVAATVGRTVVEVNAASAAGSATGSGVIITSDGEIVTNNHVISGSSQVQVTTSDGKRYDADVVGTDSAKDLALIKVRDASGLTPAALGDSADVRVGDQVVAIGSPEGLTGTVTSGIVSALDRDVTVSTDEGRQQQDDGQWPFEFGGRHFNGDTGSSTTTYKAIQTDASLNPGNSGGALFDMNGKVIGINSAMYSATEQASSADAGSVGLGFAIPVDTVKADLSGLRSGGDVQG